MVVLPSICPESFGLVVAEALSAGRPVLSTRCGGPEDQIEDGVNGWLVDANSAPAMAARFGALAKSPQTVLEASFACNCKKNHDEYLDDLLFLMMVTEVK